VSCSSRALVYFCNLVAPDESIEIVVGSDEGKNSKILSTKIY